MSTTLSPHPIHHFPTELLVQIFKCGTQTTLETLKGTNQPSGLTSIPPLPFPMLMCAVSTHWRQVALDAPDLWSTIYVPLFASKNARSLIFDPAKFTSIWLARSKAAPLTVVVDIPNLSYAFDLWINVIMPSIVKHADRLYNLVIDGDAAGVPFCNIKGIVQSIGTHLGKASAPIRLLSLSYSNRGTTRFPINSELLDRDWDLPDPSTTFNVKELRVNGIRLNPHAFPRLTSLDVSHLGSTYDELQNLFDSLPCLQELSLHQLHVMLSTPNHATSINIPTLQTLSISFQRRPLDSIVQYPIAYLTLPNLSVLKVDGNAGIPICPCFGTTLASSSNLKTLRLSNFVRFKHDPTSVSTLNDIQFLHSFTTIQSLELVHTPTEGVLFHSSSEASHLSRTPARKRSTERAQLSVAPQLQETSRTLEQVFQSIRLNGRPDLMPPPLSEASGASKFSHAEAIWPNLQSIALDTLLAEDVLNLCHYAVAKPNLKLVRLSKSASRHLSHSIKRKKGSEDFYTSSRLMRSRLEWDVDESEGVGDAADWLQQRVKLGAYESASVPHNGWDYQ